MACINVDTGKEEHSSRCGAQDLSAAIRSCVPTTECTQENGGRCVPFNDVVRLEGGAFPVTYGKCDCLAEYGYAGTYCNDPPTLADLKVTTTKTGNQITSPWNMTATWSYTGGPNAPWSVHTLTSDGVLYPIATVKSVNKTLSTVIPLIRPAGLQQIVFKLRDYTATAAISFTGTCQNLECSIDNGATCVDDENVCLCPAGFSGLRCEEDPCVHCNPYGSTCERTGPKAGICVCSEGLFGDQCDMSEDCRPTVDCGNGYLDIQTSRCSNKCVCINGWVSAPPEKLQLTSTPESLIFSKDNTNQLISNNPRNLPPYIIPSDRSDSNDSSNNKANTVFCNICALPCDSHLVPDQSCTVCECPSGFYGIACLERSIEIQMVFFIGNTNFLTNQRRRAFLDQIAFELATVLELPPDQVVGKDVRMAVLIGSQHYATTIVEFRTNDRTFQGAFLKNGKQYGKSRSRSDSIKEQVFAHAQALANGTISSSFAPMATVKEAHNAYKKLVTLINSESSTFYRQPNLSKFVLTYGIGFKDPLCLENCPTYTGSGGVIPRPGRPVYNDTSALSTGIIITIIVVIIAFIAAICLLAYFIVQKRKKNINIVDSDEKVAQKLAVMDQDIFYALSAGVSDNERQKMFSRKASRKNSAISEFEENSTQDNELRLRLDTNRKLINQVQVDGSTSVSAVDGESPNGTSSPVLIKEEDENDVHDDERSQIADPLAVVRIADTADEVQDEDEVEGVAQNNFAE